MHCDTWAGFIFINLAEFPAQPLREFLGPMITALESYPFGRMTARYEFRADIGCNWKLSRSGNSPRSSTARTPSCTASPSHCPDEHSPRRDTGVRVFTLTDDGYSVPRAPEVPAGLEDAARAASAGCPEQAITPG